MITRHVTGNYELHARIAGAGPVPAAGIRFSGGDQAGVVLHVDGNGFRVAREAAGCRTVLKDYPGGCPPPWEVRVLKKGNFFRFRVNGNTGWIRGPSGEWEGVYDPRENTLALTGTGGCGFESCTVATLPWLDQRTEPVIARGPADSHYERQIIPGAIVETGGRYYMYCMAGMEGDQEGSSRRSIAVAVSADLVNWRVHPAPVLSHADAPGDNIYVNGAVVTPEGRIVIMYAVQQYPSWLGFMTATADDPMGPFTTYSRNPVYRHFNDAAHEFDLLRVDHPDYRYLMCYAGYTPRPSGGWPGGDRGYLLYSDDLVDWRTDENNPVFGPQTEQDWDAVHVRPRSLNRIGDTWYLWYEGCNAWTPPGATPPGATARERRTGREQCSEREQRTEREQWCDSVGLARSTDLKNWSYYPRNPALPALGIGVERFDNTWTGWPRMVVKDDVGYVFYTGNAQVGLRTIPVRQLTDWASEGGDSIRIV